MNSLEDFTNKDDTDLNDYMGEEECGFMSQTSICMPPNPGNLDPGGLWCPSPLDEIPRHLEDLSSTCLPWSRPRMPPPHLAYLPRV